LELEWNTLYRKMAGIKVKGEWLYLFRIVDSDRDTVAFFFSNGQVSAGWDFDDHSLPQIYEPCCLTELLTRQRWM